VVPHNHRRAGESGAVNRQHRALGGRLFKASALGVLSGVVATAGLMMPADAAVADPHTVFVLKDDSIVEVEGLSPGEDITVEVERNGVVVGSIEGQADFGGAFIINHDVCWDGFTPQILAGDVVEVTTNAGVDTVPVTDIEVTQGPVLSGSSFTIRGTVNGPRVPVGELQVEARTNDPIRFRPLAPDVTDGVTGTISYDTATGGAFTARFTGLNAQQQEAVGNFGEFFVSHVAATGAAGDPKEVTMASEGTGAPGPGCPPTAAHAVTSLSSAVINRANQRAPLTVTGMTVDASEVSVRLRDGDGTVVTRSTTPAPATGVQTWSVTLQPAQLAELNGTIRVAGTYTVGGTALSGGTMSLLKDLVAPRSPAASPDGGAYRRRQAVSLSTGAGNQIRYTLGDGGQPAPTATSGSLYRGRQIPITASQTLKAVAVDRAGNASPVLRQRYRIGAVPSRPRILAAASGRPGGRDTAVAKWRAPLSNAARVTGYQVTALRLRANGSVAKRTTSAMLAPRARSHQMRLPAGRYRFRVQATSSAGRTKMSDRSNAVRSR
jgi:Chitobiase/beta-hexosaminidase C-terminal domain